MRRNGTFLKEAISTSTMTFSDPLSSSDEGSNDESAESFGSISSIALQKPLIDQEEESESLLRYANGSRIVRAKSRGSLLSNRSSHTLHTNSSRRQNEQRSSLILPIFRIPSYQAGIMWTGNFRRTPVFIFSQRCTIKKSDSAEKLGRMFNMTFRLIRAECKLLRSVLQSHGFQESFNHLGKFNLLWTGSHLKPCQLRLLADFHKVNHFPRSYEITRKDRLAKNVQRMQQLKGLRQFDFVPQTYILPEEFREFCSGYLHDKGPYIVKPVASSRGRGIYIVSHPEQIPYDEPMIVSRYISNPFLLDGFKFDVRIYAAVTSYEPLVVYMYEEGLVRFATVRYQVGTRHLKTQCMHLTNYSVNKKNFEFVQNDDANVEDFGNKWSLGALLRYLKSEGADVTGLMVRIEEIIIKSFLCVVNPIASACAMFQACRSKCFELYGFDIIVDEDFRPWLLEVNLSPSLACDSPLDFKVKSHMITDLFNLVGIVCHDPTRKTQGGMNSLHVKADGHTAVPPKLPTYFVSAEEQINGRAGPNGKFRHQDSSRDRMNTCCSTSDGCAIGLAGVPSSHLLPKGVTIEETRLMRRLQEEAARAGGWIRLIPHPEVWEQYANIWPNDASPLFSGHDRRLYTSTDGSRTSLVDIRHPDRRLPGNSLIASAFMAASAIAHLYNVVATVNSHECSDNSDNDDDDDDDQDDSHSQSSSQFEINHRNTRVRKIPCASHSKFLHPNTSIINVDLVSHLHQSNKHHGSGDYHFSIISNPLNPTTTAVNRTRLALHNMPHGQMRTCLDSLLNKSSCSSPIPHEQCQRVVACYAHTLGHMPFYLRKLGDPPFNLLGVCLRSSCSHDRACKTAQCGIYHATRIQKPGVPSRVGSFPSEVNPCESVSNMFGQSGDSYKTFVRTPRPDSARKHRTHSNLGIIDQRSSKSTTNLTEFDASQLSVSQARHAFAAYLSRIQSRLLFEAKQPSLHQGLGKIAMQKEHRQLDLMICFLRRASEHLSLQAIATICSKESIDKSSGDIRNFFHATIPDNSRPLSERKRVLARLLNKFIEIYQYETVAMLSSHRSKSHKVTKCLETNRFWKFLRSATESQLETVLSQYTRLHHSVDVFMGRALDHVGSPYEEFTPNAKTIHGRSRSRSVELSASIPKGVASSSSDSGFASSGDTAIERSPISVPIRQDSMQCSGLDFTISSQKCHPTRSNVSNSPRISEVTETKLSTWSSCCPTLRRHSSDSLSCPEDSTTNKQSDLIGHMKSPIEDNKARSRGKANIMLSKTQPKKYQNKRLSLFKSTSPYQGGAPLINSSSQAQNKDKQSFAFKKDRNLMRETQHTSCNHPPQTAYTVNSASQTCGATVSMRSSRSRQCGHRSTIPSESQHINQPLMYATRSRPRTALSRTRISSNVRPRSAYRNPAMIPLCSFKGTRPVLLNNHNADSIEFDHNSMEPVNHIPIQYDCDIRRCLTSAIHPRELSHFSTEQRRPGVCPPLCTSFAVQSDCLLPKSSWFQSVADDCVVEPAAALRPYKVNRPCSASRQPFTLQCITNPNLIRTSSLRRVRPTS